MTRLAVVVLTCVVPATALAQNALTVTAIAGYGSFETAGVWLTLSGDADRDATYAVTFATGGQAPRAGHPLVRFDATHAATSLFGLSPATAYTVTVTATDPDGVTGGSQTTVVTTRTELGGPPAALRDLYVSTTGVDVAGGGTLGAPFRTLQYAVAAVNPGDHVHLAAGVYRESVTLSRSGTAPSPIVIDGAAGAVLDGSDATLAAGTATWLAAGNVYSTAVAFTTQYVAIDGQRLWHDEVTCPLPAAATPHVPGDWCITGGRLYVRLSGNASPAGRAVQASVLPAGINLQNASFVRIRGLEIRFYGDSSGFGKGIYVRSSSDNVIQNNAVHNCANPIWLRIGDRNVVQDNEIYDTAISGWPWADAKAHEAEAAGIVVTDVAGLGTVIRRNRVRGTFDGINFCGTLPAVTSETEVYDNVVDDHLDDGAEADGACVNARVYRNVFSRSLMGVSLAPASPGPLFLVRNVVYRHRGNPNAISSSFKFNYGGSEITSNVFAYHNTTVSDRLVAGAPLVLGEEPAQWMGSPGAAQNVIFRNNIFASNEYTLYSANTALAIDFDYDDLYTSHPTEFAYWQSLASRHVTTLASLTAQTGIEAHGITGRPTFVDLDAGDLRPLAASPVVDRGLVIAGINDDYAGAGPDLGAFELPAQADAGADAGTPDAGTVDAGTPDAGTSIDAGAPDAGAPVDAGAIDDAGTPDAGTPFDAGTPADAGAPTDAGASTDAGTPDGGGSMQVGGCGCGATGPTFPLAVLLALAGRALRRRTRANSGCS